jgi:hypothetical protein
MNHSKQNKNTISNLELSFLVFGSLNFTFRSAFDCEYFINFNFYWKSPRITWRSLSSRGFLVLMNFGLFDFFLIYCISYFLYSYSSSNYSLSLLRSKSPCAIFFWKYVEWFVIFSSSRSSFAYYHNLWNQILWNVTFKRN